MNDPVIQAYIDGSKSADVFVRVTNGPTTVLFPFFDESGYHRLDHASEWTKDTLVFASPDAVTVFTNQLGVPVQDA